MTVTTYAYDNGETNELYVGDLIIFMIISTKNTDAKAKICITQQFYCTVLWSWSYSNDKHDLFVCRIPPGPSSLSGLQNWNQVLRVAQ
jgi:hypothetical protein